MVEPRKKITRASLGRIGREPGVRVIWLRPLLQRRAAKSRDVVPPTTHHASSLLRLPNNGICTSLLRVGI